MKQNCNKYCGWCKKKEKKEEESKEEKEEEEKEEEEKEENKEEEEEEKENEKKEEDEEEGNEKEEEKEEDKENEEENEDYDETCKDKTASCRYWKHQQYCSKTSRSVFIVLVQVYSVPTSVESRGSFSTIVLLI